MNMPVVLAPGIFIGGAIGKGYGGPVGSRAGAPYKLKQFADIANRF